MAGYQPPFRDIRFVLSHIVDLAGLSALPPFAHADPTTVDALVEEYGRFVSEILAPLDRPGDLQGVRFDPASNSVQTADGFADAYRQYAEAGWGSVPFPPDHGGGGFPWLVAIVLQELLTSANLSFSMAPLLTQGAIDLLESHGSEEQQEQFLRRMVSGEWTGTMNLTEPEAGSDVGALRTKAVPTDDGSYRISGTKIFITYGEHDLADNIVHLVLARVPDAPPGTKGISCFIVPKYLVNEDGSLGERNGVRCIGVEHKMGIHASPTCTLEYDGAVGYLIGSEPNRGMAQMFTMMNNARLSVGLEGLSVSECAYQQALEFAQERHQGRAVGSPAGTSSPIIEHADVRRMLLTMRSTIEAMRMLLYTNALAIDLARHHPDEQVRVDNQELADLLTPISKAWSTDQGNLLTSLAIQIHGGMGFIEETGVAQRYRDMRIAAIYEGTNGIQAMDLVGRKLPMRGGAVLKDFLATVAALDDELAGAGDDFVSIRTNLRDGIDAVTEGAEWLMANGAGDPVEALAGATPFLELFGLVVGGWLLARQALAAQAAIASGGGDADFFQAKITTARFFCEQRLPQARGLLGAVTAGRRDLFAITPEQLTGT